MKKNILAAFLLFTLFFSQVCALSSPKPIKGNPSIITNVFTTTVGNTTLNIKVPVGWGIGEVQTSAEESASIQVFPAKGGLGFSVEMKKFSDPTAAKAALAEIQKTFSSVTILADGFETKRSRAFFSCHVQGSHLIQIWYAFPKKEKKYTRHWRDFRGCVTLSSGTTPPIDQPVVQEPAEILPIQESGDMGYGDDDKSYPDQKSRKILSAVELPRRGWALTHPEGALRVVFETFPLIKCTPNQDVAATYLLQFEDNRANGFLYVSWDQLVWDRQVSDDKEPYRMHLQAMSQEILALEPNQKFEQDPEYYLKDGYAIIRGNPYGLITLSGDGFLFGFAIKDKDPLMSHDISEYTNRIKWQILN